MLFKLVWGCAMHIARLFSQGKRQFVVGKYNILNSRNYCIVFRGELEWPGGREISVYTGLCNKALLEWTLRGVHFIK